MCVCSSPNSLCQVNSGNWNGFCYKQKLFKLLYNWDAVFWQTVPSPCGAAGLLFMFSHSDQLFYQFGSKLLVNLTDAEVLDLAPKPQRCLKTVFHGLSTSYSCEIKRKRSGWRKLCIQSRRTIRSSDTTSLMSLTEVLVCTLKLWNLGLLSKAFWWGGEEARQIKGLKRCSR